MKMDKWSGYAKYLVLSDNSKGKIKPNYIAYLEFKKIKASCYNLTELTEKIFGKTV